MKIERGLVVWASKWFLIGATREIACINLEGGLLVFVGKIDEKKIISFNKVMEFK